MINKVESEYETAIGRLICGGEITDKATAFLISPTKAITATHALDEYYLEEGEICLEFLNINKEPIKEKHLLLSFPKLHMHQLVFWSWKNLFKVMCI